MLITAIARTIDATGPNSGTMCVKLSVSPLTPVHAVGSTVGNPIPLSVICMSIGSADERFVLLV